MKAPRPVTPRQLEVLRKIREALLRAGRPPSIRELMEVLKVSSTNCVAEFLEALERKALIARASGVRNIIITKRGWSALGECCPCAGCSCACHRIGGVGA